MLYAGTFKEYIFQNNGKGKRIKKARACFQRLMPSPSFSLAFMAVQLLIIITLGVYILQLKHEYRTLSAPSVMVSEPVKINIVFKEKTTRNRDQEPAVADRRQDHRRSIFYRALYCRDKIRR